MGNVGITLSLSDPAGVNMLGAFRDMGFEETDRESILRMGEIYLFTVDPLIVPEERYKVPKEPDPDSEIILVEGVDEVYEIGYSHRIGVTEDLPEELRFFVKGNRFVSK